MSYSTLKLIHIDRSILSTWKNRTNYLLDWRICFAFLWYCRLLLRSWNDKYSYHRQLNPMENTALYPTSYCYVHPLDCWCCQTLSLCRVVTFTVQVIDRIVLQWNWRFPSYTACATSWLNIALPHRTHYPSAEHCPLHKTPYPSAIDRIGARLVSRMLLAGRWKFARIFTAISECGRISGC